VNFSQTATDKLQEIGLTAENWLKHEAKKLIGKNHRGRRSDAMWRRKLIARELSLEDFVGFVVFF
jgi:hypothetical protein